MDAPRFAHLLSRGDVLGHGAGSIVAKELRRGNSAVSRDDSITLVLDTFYDRRNGFYSPDQHARAVDDAHSAQLMRGFSQIPAPIR